MWPIPPRAFNRFIRRLCQKKWVVYAKPPFGGPQQTLSYLGRYTHRVAISNHRLLDLQGDQIRFTFRSRKHGDRSELAQLDAHTFIERFLMHVLPSVLSASAITACWPTAAKPIPCPYAGRL